MINKKLQEFINLRKEQQDLKILLSVLQIKNPCSFNNNYSKRYLYFIKGCDLVKIGVSNDVENRLKILQTGFPSKLEILFKKENYGHKEKEIHKKFNHLKCNGEWYFLTNEIYNFIEELK